MAVDAIVRVSFQSNPVANQAATVALTGGSGVATPGPFVKAGTAAFSCAEASELDVARALVGLGAVLADHANDIDFVAVTMVRRSDT